MESLNNTIMVKKLNKTFPIIGVSGKKYIFDNMYTFDDFDTLKNAFKAVEAVYIFTVRLLNGDEYTHELVYCGETGNLSTRFDNHHAEYCIKRNNANCISIMTINGEELRKQIEADILKGNTFPCNTIHQNY